MKVFLWSFFLIFCCHFMGNGQIYFVDEHFNSAPSVPAGFTGGGGAFGSGTAVSNYGRNSPSIQFKVDGQTLTYGPWSGEADQVSFFHKALGGNGSSFTIEESADGLTWTTAGNMTAITTGATYTGPLLGTSRYLRLTFHLVVVNVYVDDLRIRAATNACVDNITILELLINGSCGSCEGSEEWIYFDTGGNPLNIGDLELVSQTVSAGGCAYGGVGFGDNLNTNWVQAGSYTPLQTAYIASLNTWAACPGVFVPVPANNIIPAYARVIAFTGALPTAPYNFGAICGLGTVYIIFADQTNCGGKYSNASCSANCDRYITLFNHGTGCVDNQLYYANSVATTAGNAYIFVPPAIGYTATATCSALVLDIELRKFESRCVNGQIEISGEVWSNTAEDMLFVEKSTDGIHYATCCIPELNMDGELTQFICTPEKGSASFGYYRLKMINASGLIKYSQVIFAGCQQDDAWFSAFATQDEFTLHANHDLSQVELFLYNVTGQLLFSKQVNMKAGEQLVENSIRLSPGVYTITLNDLHSSPVKICVR